LNGPHLVLSRGKHNVVKYNDQYYVVPQRYGTLHLDVVQDRCRPNIICVGTLNEALAHLGDKVTIPVIFVVGADKGGTGKTTLCRVLLDWLDEHLPPGSILRTFDTQLPLGNLKRFRSGVDVVNINDVEDQMKVFDNVEDAQATVVDVCAGNLFSILETLDKAGLLKDIASGAVRMVVMHVVGPNIASMEEIGEVMARIGGGAVRPVLIKNHYTKTKFKVAEDPRYAEALRLAAPGTINVPQLASEAMEEIEMQGVGFAQFIKGLDVNNQPLPKRNSRMLVGYTAQWLQSVWGEFDRVNIANVFSS
jgi:hypothetical protein